MFMKIVSSVIIGIKKGGKFLLLKDNKNNVWHFPHGEFDENLNGNLDNTVKRILKPVVGRGSLQDADVDYLGSFLRKENGRVLIGYDFLIENFDGEIIAKNHKWVDKGELKSMKVDKITSTFLKINKC